MRVAVNAAVMAHPLTGVARYAFELGRALSGLGHEVEYWTWNRFRSSLRERLGPGPVVRTFPHLHGIGPAVIPLLTSMTARIDVHHFPNGDLLPSRAPRTAMIHDMAPFLFDGILDPGVRDFYRRRTARVVRECAAITVNSMTTLDHLLEVFPEARGRCHPTPLGCDHELVPPGGPDDLPPGVRPGYLLSVGTVEPRKDYPTAIRASKLLLERLGASSFPGLVIAGGDGYSAQETRALVRELGMGGMVHFTGFVGEGTLSTLYAHASAYIHSSLHEGFGLTVAEAIRQGLPVAAARNSAIVELFDGLFVGFETGSAESAAEAAAVALAMGRGSTPGDRACHATKVLTWENCARLTEGAFREVTGA